MFGSRHIGIIPDWFDDNVYWGCMQQIQSHDCHVRQLFVSLSHENLFQNFSLYFTFFIQSGYIFFSFLLRFDSLQYCRTGQFWMKYNHMFSTFFVTFSHKKIFYMNIIWRASVYYFMRSDKNIETGIFKICLK